MSERNIDVTIKADTCALNRFREIPSRKCLVCECWEHWDATLIYNDKAWLCDDCKMALNIVRDRLPNILRVLEREDTE